MKLSVQTQGAVNRLGVDAGMAAIRRAGFDAVDLNLCCGMQYEGIKNGAKTDFYDDDKIYPYVDEIASAAKKYGLAFGQAHAPAPLYIHGADEGNARMQSYARKCIEVCGYIGCPALVIHPLCNSSARFPKWTKQQQFLANIEFYSSMIPLLKKHNVICCLENMWISDWKTGKIYTEACSNVNEVIQYVDELNAMAGEKCFGFCLDVGHLLLLGEDPCYWMEMLGDRIVALHTHDNDGLHDDHTLPYIGVCNWDRFILGLRKIGYSGNLNFETATFNDMFPKELIPSALMMLGSTAKYLYGRITAETDSADQ
jgi:sugar phosphate isomerase/epimerase